MQRTNRFDARAERIAAEQRWREAQQTPVMSLPEVSAIEYPATQQKSAEGKRPISRSGNAADAHPALPGGRDYRNQQADRFDAKSVRNSIQERYQVARNPGSSAFRQRRSIAGRNARDQASGVQ